MSNVRSRSVPRCEQNRSASSDRVNLRSCGCARRYLPSTSPVPNGPGRSRSSTASSWKTRSRTPSNHPSSGHNSPTPTPGCNARMGLGERTQSESALLDLQEEPKLSQQRFVSTSQLKSKGATAVYTTTVLIRIGSSRRHMIDEIKYEMKLTPQKHQRPENNASTEKQQSRQRRFRTEFEVELQRPSHDTTLIRIHRPTPTSVLEHNNCEGKEKEETNHDEPVDDKIPEQDNEEEEDNEEVVE
ncbi:hypothetical protein LSTR_LSTR010667 [Laodelphax striatellus]|uniref:Uncharacterized protein n=1 Tax=Laodelphax striatellus TaxID=195883 RepID=A0A482WTE0_LAOST|nr:hypothetical protein LSTR_LSTR010667 [Laodelphax striatellus]